MKTRVTIGKTNPDSSNNNVIIAQITGARNHLSIRIFIGTKVGYKNEEGI